MKWHICAFGKYDTRDSKDDLDYKSDTIPDGILRQYSVVSIQRLDMFSQKIIPMYQDFFKVEWHN